MVSKDTAQDWIAAIIVGLAFGIATWAYTSGHLTPELAANLLEIVAEAAPELAD